MGKHFKSKQVTFLASILILVFCTIGMSQDIQEDQKSLTPIEQKMLQKITLNFRDVPIDDILRSISEQVELNIVKSPEITATVTVSVKDVPLEEALNQILTVYGCGYVASENMIRIVPATQLAQETERTTSKIYRIVYADVKQVEQALSNVISDRGTIASSTGTSNIIVTDTESNIRAIDSFIEEIDRATPLIMVEVRIYDIKNTNALDLGVEWRIGRNTGYGTGRGIGTTGLEPSGGPVTGSSNSNPFISSNFDSTTNKVGSTGILNWGIITEHMDMDVLFSAIQEKDCANLLANPRIMVLDNETASFKAIEEIPYQQLQQGGYQSFGTTEFKEVGVELKVTPHVAKDEMVRLHVMPVFSVHVDDVEISTVGTGGATVTSPQPVVDKREADTVALVKSGQTIVIGGLQKQTINQLTTKVPLLGDIPILGWFFTFEGEETVNSELVVFITPRIIEDNTLTETEAIYLESTNFPSPVPPQTRLGNEDSDEIEEAVED